MCIYSWHYFACGHSRRQYSMQCEVARDLLHGPEVDCRVAPKGWLAVYAPRHWQGTYVWDELKFDDVDTHGPGVCHNYGCRWNFSLLPNGMFYGFKENAEDYFDDELDHNRHYGAGPSDPLDPGNPPSAHHAVQENKARFNMDYDACKMREYAWHQLLTTDEQTQALTIKRPTERAKQLAQSLAAGGNINTEGLTVFDLNPGYLDENTLRICTARLLPASVTYADGLKATSSKPWEQLKELVSMGIPPRAATEGPFRPAEHACRFREGWCVVCGVCEPKVEKKKGGRGKGKGKKRSEAEALAQESFSRDRVERRELFPHMMDMSSGGCLADGR